MRRYSFGLWGILVLVLATYEVRSTATAAATTTTTTTTLLLLLLLLLLPYYVLLLLLPPKILSIRHYTTSTRY